MIRIHNKYNKCDDVYIEFMYGLFISLHISNW